MWGMWESDGWQRTGTRGGGAAGLLRAGCQTTAASRARASGQPGCGPPGGAARACHEQAPPAANLGGDAKGGSGRKRCGSRRGSS